MAEKGRRFSPYNYAFDNPIRFIDPDGMWPDLGILLVQYAPAVSKATNSAIKTVKNAAKSAGESLAKLDKVISTELGGMPFHSSEPSSGSDSKVRKGTSPEPSIDVAPFINNQAHGGAANTLSGKITLVSELGGKLAEAIDTKEVNNSDKKVDKVAEKNAFLERIEAPKNSGNAGGGFSKDSSLYINETYDETNKNVIQRDTLKFDKK